MLMEEKTFTWEARLDELLALKSIYCEEGECEIISPSSLSFGELTASKPSDCTISDIKSTAMCICIKLSCEQVTTHRLCSLAVVIDLGSNYPQDAPTISEISSEQLPKHVTDGVLERANIFVTTLQPEPCLFEALERIKEEVLNLGTWDQWLPPCDGLTKGDGDVRSAGGDSRSADKAKAHQTENPTSKRAFEKQTFPETFPTTCHVCVAKLDHMRNEQKYLKLLSSWAKELDIYGKILHTGSHAIYVIITGTSASSVNEFLKQWRTQNVDVDSKGRPCKEKLLRVVCQRELSNFVASWSRDTGRYICTCLL